MQNVLVRGFLNSYKSKASKNISLIKICPYVIVTHVLGVILCGLSADLTGRRFYRSKSKAICGYPHTSTCAAASLACRNISCCSSHKRGAPFLAAFRLLPMQILDLADHRQHSNDLIVMKSAHIISVLDKIMLELTT